jgi:hypothetical protein
MQRSLGSRLTHSRLMRRLAPTHFNTVVTVGAMTIVFDDYNQPIAQTFQPSEIDALINIPAYKEPLGDQENAKPNQISITDKFAIALAGYFPQIRTNDTAKINERLYNITGVTSDDTDTITFLNVQIVNPLITET